VVGEGESENVSGGEDSESDSEGEALRPGPWHRDRISDFFRNDL